MFTAASPFGSWEYIGDPCLAPQAELTFGGQSTYVLPNFVFMADKWNSRNLKDSPYIWLPIAFINSNITIGWKTNGN
jgi:hypothetical protein